MIPEKYRPEWRSLLLSDTQQQFRFLALKLLMNRLRSRLRTDQSPSTVDACVGELHAFAIKNERFVQADLASIFR
ncbi:MAG: hypothetical protein KC933_33050 [Myxococcales bacterium]|nr:hypothetical protein [Myxococcales bacterium]